MLRPLIETMKGFFIAIICTHCTHIDSEEDEYVRVAATENW